MNVTRLDIYLLRCLDALVLEQHVTRAADRMGMSQPAMSATLAKLRVLCGDLILVRTERGMALTPRALEIIGPVRTALELIDGTFSAEAPFDPSRSTAQIEVAATESVAFVLMPTLIGHLRRVAPGVGLRLHAPDLTRLRQSLENGEADLMVSFLRDAPEGLRSTALLKQDLCVIAAKNHPTIQGALSLAQYLEVPHVLYAPNRNANATIENEIDAALRLLGADRTIGVRLPSALSSPAAVAASDLIATIPQRVADHFAPIYGLQVLKPPIALPEVQISMYWHERMHASPAHRWLRQALLDLAKGLSS